MTGCRSGLVRQRHAAITALGLAIDSIRAHKLRSFLTLLGVMIGVASVLLVGASIEGLGAYAETNTAKIFGGNAFLVAQVASASSTQEYYRKLRRHNYIRHGDVQYLEAAAGDWVSYSPYRSQAAEVRHGGITYEDGLVAGVSAALPEIREIALVEGRFFSKEEDRMKQFVAVIGDDVRATLFPVSAAVDGIIHISGTAFRVIGVLERLGSSFGQSQDNVIYIPGTAFTRIYGTRQSFHIYGTARQGTGLSLQEALDITRMSLRARFRTRLGQPDPFDHQTPDGLRAWVDGILRLISALAIPVTCISLLVGGIVILNIMLVTVTERTYEIGIRKSLGARASDIQLQFLLEAVLLAALGGAAGVLLGFLAAGLLSHAIGVALSVPVSYVALALAVSSVVGIASGWYPARRAARMNPVAALKAE